LGLWTIKKSRSIDGLHAFCPDITLDIEESTPKPNIDKEIVDELIEDIKHGLILDKDYQREELLCWIKCKRMRAEEGSS
jgi:hypothetical protein